MAESSLAIPSGRWSAKILPMRDCGCESRLATNLTIMARCNSNGQCYKKGAMQFHWQVRKQHLGTRHLHNRKSIIVNAFLGSTWPLWWPWSLQIMDHPWIVLPQQDCTASKTTLFPSSTSLFLRFDISKSWISSLVFSFYAVHIIHSRSLYLLAINGCPWLNSSSTLYSCILLLPLIVYYSWVWR